MIRRLNLLRISPLFINTTRNFHSTTTKMPRRERSANAKDDDNSDVEVVETNNNVKAPANTAAAAAKAPAKSKATLVQSTLSFAPKPKTTTANPAATTGATSDLDLKSYLLEPEWTKALAPAFAAPYMTGIHKQINGDRAAGKQVFPPPADIFTALNVCPLSQVRVVLIGQDPYHDNNQAHGLCFSVQPGVKVPPSLMNMYKELKTDIPGFVPPNHGYLISWARQGVLMLNATLTVEAHKANSHEKCGWQQFTDAVIDVVNKREKPAVFLLWGNFAKKKGARVDRAKHKVIENAHPSPLSATKWWGCKPFSKCNDALVQLGQQPIDWTLPAVAKKE